MLRYIFTEYFTEYSTILLQRNLFTLKMLILTKIFMYIKFSEFYITIFIYIIIFKDFK